MCRGNTYPPYCLFAPRVSIALFPRHRLRRMTHAKGELLPQEIKGTHHSKALPIDLRARKRIVTARAEKTVRREGADYRTQGEALRCVPPVGDNFSACMIRAATPMWRRLWKGVIPNLRYSLSRPWHGCPRTAASTDQARSCGLSRHRAKRRRSDLHLYVDEVSQEIRDRLI